MKQIGQCQENALQSSERGMKKILQERGVVGSAALGEGAGNFYKEVAVKQRGMEVSVASTGREEYVQKPRGRCRPGLLEEVA